MIAIYWSYSAECAVCADEPTNSTCMRCREGFWDESGNQSYCDSCMDYVSGQIDAGKEQPR